MFQFFIENNIIGLVYADIKSKSCGARPRMRASKQQGKSLELILAKLPQLSRSQSTSHSSACRVHFE